MHALFKFGLPNRKKPVQLFYYTDKDKDSDFLFLFCGAYLEDGNERANVYGGGSERIDSAPGVFNPMRYPWTRNPLSPWTLFGKFSLN